MGEIASSPRFGESPAGPLLLSLRLSATVEAVPRARHALRAVLAERAPRAPVDTLELLLSELVTNAVQHSTRGRTVAVAVLRRENSIRIAVVDDDTALPEAGGAVDLLDEHGRGLLLVEAMAEEWGSYPVPDGKVVWCDVKTVE
ncbi:ATP-binding protein [Embleya hyalina]|uniref:ATPase n=1 Tax=Embleya hyalina TaxID=516124 RepID=A0A401YY46_9ACTN|nr:ATP-binding protein [Embleya hyalina]GCD99537.1 ATPase [Embleya hyalina]